MGILITDFLSLEAVILLFESLVMVQVSLTVLRRMQCCRQYPDDPTPWSLDSPGWHRNPRR